MQLWKRVWCWLAGHDWVRLLSDVDRSTARGDLHRMAGHMGYCARCGYFWDDLPKQSQGWPRAPRPEPEHEPAPNVHNGDPYRTPAPLPACRCSGGTVHPDCPRHFETAREQKPRASATRSRRHPSVLDPSDGTVRKVVVVQVNGKTVTATGDEADELLREAEGIWNDFERSFEEMGESFGRMAKDFGKTFDRGSRVERIRRIRRHFRDDEDTN